MRKLKLNVKQPTVEELQGLKIHEETEDYIIYIPKNKGPLIYVWKDEFLAYRITELQPDIIDLIEKAWKRGHSVQHNEINKIIKLQNENLEMCKRYIGYKYLGTHNYLEVYGEKAQRDYKELEEKKEKEEFQKQIAELQGTIKDMQQQLWDMQGLLLSMAKSQQNNMLLKKSG